MEKLVVSNHSITLDKKYYKKFNSLKIYVEKIRGKFFPRVRFNNKKRKMLAHLILKPPKGYRLSYKDHNTLNLKKSNLYISTKSHKQNLMKKWIAKNKEKINKRIIKKYQENKKPFLKRQKKYRKTNKGRRFIFKNNRTIRSKWRKVKEGAKRRGYGFYIPYTFYKNLFKNPYCVYCYKDVRNECGGNLDRINNNRGYYKDNVVLSCGECNKIRGRRFSVEEMKCIMNYIKRIRKKQ